MTFGGDFLAGLDSISTRDFILPFSGKITIVEDRTGFSADVATGGFSTAGRATSGSFAGGFRTDGLAAAETGGFAALSGGGASGGRGLN